MTMTTISKLPKNTKKAVKELMALEHVLDARVNWLTESRGETRLVLLLKTISSDEPIRAGRGEVWQLGTTIKELMPVIRRTFKRHQVKYSVISKPRRVRRADKALGGPVLGYDSNALTLKLQEPVTLSEALWGKEVMQENGGSSKYTMSYDEEQESAAYELANSEGIRIVRKHEYYLGVVENEAGKLVAALFTGFRYGEYSFDIVVHPEHRGRGLATSLVNAAIQDFVERATEEAEYFDDPEDVPEEVLNPVMRPLVISQEMYDLLTKKGFEVVEQGMGDGIVMELSLRDASRATFKATLTEARMIEIDEQQLREATESVYETIVDVVDVFKQRFGLEEDNAMAQVLGGRALSVNDVYTYTSTNVKGEPITVTINWSTNPSRASKSIAGAEIVKAKQVNSYRVRLFLNSNFKLKFLLEDVKQDVENVLAHELVHAHDIIRYDKEVPYAEDSDAERAAYYNSPEEVRAFMRTFYQNNKARILKAIEQGTPVKDALFASIKQDRDWANASAHYTEQNKKKVLKALIRAFSTS